MARRHHAIAWWRRQVYWRQVDNARSCRCALKPHTPERKHVTELQGISDHVLECPENGKNLPLLDEAQTTIGEHSGQNRQAKQVLLFSLWVLICIGNARCCVLQLCKCGGKLHACKAAHRVPATRIVLSISRRSSLSSVCGSFSCFACNCIFALLTIGTKGIEGKFWSGNWHL